ncbi:ARF-binding protein [Ophidiomyces ophidiicola]|uniref:ARF-binding protein n=1 Tax=Ophidiomyces ophidiicola TaxID=1387563 RepID=UPI0020C25DCD|nr:ARF-binding protein [Ophidiomyces ophidiicola]KAI1947995.1 ARF-binding protein [Ophidiomyces ophidiicola]KAI1949725.1 ARF-binding protein [Ophidiomyces ophidiicola]KAI1961613.1 ARF-binding protein [Ophidiomyces ophidiicola]KAI1974201.1 ARF-binding protein [Ophidiomyces ophidiicola]KAI1992340.1 ARF-binding protein [Ophidiomyces ophidiicola]
MAARDRFGTYAEPARSTLQRYIYNACDPQNYEPNLALNLEVVDLVNSKKGNAPREAAISIVQLINSRNANVALLALSLLDICVKNCGYPFHLQISTKEFLNELVRRFPERPPIRSSRVQQRILECIEEWRQTICQTSRYKEDLGYIRDMHRLLLYKGYMFPEVRREDAAVLNPSDNLQSAEEMEEEEKEAQSAKLQELIRRGGPEDLREANRLMKIMAGYDTRHKTDYRAKAAEEVGKVQQKAKILEEMLQNHKPGDSIAEGDVFEDLANALRSAHPKIQKMCEEESEDAEAVSKLLEINDSIYRTIERYKLIKAGDVQGATKIPKGTLGTSTGVKKNAENELSLIDFDDPTPTNGNSSSSQASGGTSSLENDLLGLSFQDSSQPSGSISLPLRPGAGSPNQTTLPSLGTSSPTPQPLNSASMSAAAHPSGSTLQGDPFASLVSSGSRTSSPFRQLQSPKAPSPSSSALLDVGQPFSPPNLQTTANAPADDEWTFTSSLPEDALPTSNQTQVLNSSINIVFFSRRIPRENRIQVIVQFSNNSTQAISQVHFQVAIEKAYKLQVSPQSGRQIAPLQRNGIRQELQLNGVEPGNGNSVRLRFKVSYKLGQESKEEDGHVPPLGVI